MNIIENQFLFVFFSLIWHYALLMVHICGLCNILLKYAHLCRITSCLVYTFIGEFIANATEEHGTNFTFENPVLGCGQVYKAPTIGEKEESWSSFHPWSVNCPLK